MIPVVLLCLQQFIGAALVITVFLVVSRQIGLSFYQNAAVLLTVFILSGLALVGAVWGIFVRPWWLYLIVSSLLAVAIFFLTFALLDLLVPGTLAKLGPAGTVFLLPMLAFFFAYPTGGVLQWLLKLTKT